MTGAAGAAFGPARGLQARRIFPWRLLLTIATAALLIGAASPSPGVVFAAGSSLAVIVALLLRSDEPSVMLVPALYQWSEIAVKPILSGLYHVPINTLAEYGGDIESGAYFAFSALTAFVSTYALITQFGKRDYDIHISSEIYKMRYYDILKLSFSMIILGAILSALAFRIAALEQILLAVSLIEICGLFILTYWCLKNRRGLLVLAFVMILEIIIGFSGFFADFRTPIVGFFIGVICARPKIGFRSGAGMVVMLIITIFLASFWSYVKRDYRFFISAGAMNEQAVVPIPARLGYMANQLASFDEHKFETGLNEFLNRFSYIDFLSNTLENVPYAVPHEGGARLRASFLHVVAPRILFPDKAALESDTEVTLKYSGVNLNATEDTSISIGYLGELYVDFNKTVAVILCAAAGALYGLGHAALRAARGPVFVRFAFCSAFALAFGNFEQALIKEVGGVLTAFIGLWLAERYLMPKLWAMCVGRSQGLAAARALRTP